MTVLSAMSLQYGRWGPETRGFGSWSAETLVGPLFLLDAAEEGLLSRIASITESGREGCLGGPLRQGLTRPIFFRHQMYLLYVDEFGDPQNRDENHYVLGGLAVFERQTHWLSQNLD
ncbi:MAG: DUF3800 domain-containing protein [Gemmatimonadota bacterium]|jgi:hypothetical protein